MTGRHDGGDGTGGGGASALAVPLDGELLDTLFVASPPADRSLLLGNAAAEAREEWADRRPADLARVRASDYRFTGVVVGLDAGLRPALGEYDVAAVEAADREGSGADADGDPFAAAFGPEREPGSGPGRVGGRGAGRDGRIPAEGADAGDGSDAGLDGSISTIALAREAQADVVAGVRDELFYRARNHALFEPLAAVVDELCLGRLHAARVDAILGDDPDGADRLAAFRLAGVRPGDTDADDLREYLAETCVSDDEIRSLLAIDDADLRDVQEKLVSRRLDRVDRADGGGTRGPPGGPGAGETSGPCGRCGDPARLYVRDVADGGYLPACRGCALDTVRRYASVLDVDPDAVCDEPPATGGGLPAVGDDVPDADED